jgi:N-acyl-L-homoserine lactone synthetase
MGTEQWVDGRDRIAASLGLNDVGTGGRVIVPPNYVSPQAVAQPANASKIYKKDRRPAWEFIEKIRPGDGPYYVSRAHSDQDLAAVDFLWNSVYGDECGWLEPARGPRYLDRYHAHSTYLVAKAEGRPVGTMRLVANSAEGLPIEQFVDISDLHGNRALVECQRLMILQDFRNRRWRELPYGVLGALFKACLHWSLANSHTYIIADLFTSTKTTPISMLRGMGFEETGKEFIDTELAEPGTSIALILRLGELFSRPFRTDNPFYRYLAEYDDNIDVYALSRTGQ